MPKKEPIQDQPTFSAEEDRLLKTQDGVMALYIAQNRKVNETAKALSTYTVNLMGDDKGFERWHKLSTTLKDLVEGLEYLRTLVVKQYGTDQVDESNLKETNILEQFISDKRRHG